MSFFFLIGYFQDLLCLYSQQSMIYLDSFVLDLSYRVYGRFQNLWLDIFPWENFWLSSPNFASVSFSFSSSSGINYNWGLPCHDHWAFPFFLYPTPYTWTRPRGSGCPSEKACWHTCDHLLCTHLGKLFRVVSLCVTRSPPSVCLRTCILRYSCLVPKTVTTRPSPSLTSQPAFTVVSERAPGIAREGPGSGSASGCLSRCQGNVI